MAANISYPVWLVPLLIIGLVGTSIGAAVGYDEAGADQTGIAASGEQRVFLDPDQAELTVRVETRAATAEVARSMNAEKMQAVINALKAAGLTDKDLETTAFNLYRETNWNPETGRQTQGDYVATHSLKVETKDITNVGKYIDIAVANGANGVDSVTFELSSEKEAEYQREALQAASTIAKNKAQAVADGFNVELGDIIQLSSSFESSSGMPWIYARSEAAQEDKAASNIQPQQLEYVAVVNVVYEIDD